MKQLPTGTVTFLFTDIVSSTPLWEKRPQAMSAALEIHNAVLHQAISSHGGTVFKIVGDAFQAVFPTALPALQAAIQVQRELPSAPWNELGPLKVRIGLHTGEAHPDEIGDEYAVSHTKNRVSRIMSAGFGSQILLSQETALLVERDLPEGVQLKDLGEHRLKGMSYFEHLYQVLAPGIPEKFPPLTSQTRTLHNLPKQTTPFIGRDVELAKVAKLLGKPDTRLVTLLGPGGMGKTRLALEAAKTQLPYFKNGIALVPLAPLSSADNIIPAIAEAVGIQFFEGSDPKEQLIDYFRTKQFFLVLDNFEHVLDGVGLVSDILQAAPNVKILATSREKLNLQGEVRFRIEGMDFPEEIQPTSLESASQYSAIRLFIDSANRASPSFEPVIEDLTHIIRICCLIGGIPLGIILAAAWVEMFSPQEIAEEVSRNLDFLETEFSDIPERHRSMRAVFNSTWKQLTVEERESFMKLAIFRGGFRREAAQAVAGANLQKLISFVSKSMLHRDPSSGRYEVHELLRQYAEGHLEGSGQIEYVRNLHSAYYATFLEERLGEMLGPRQVKALDEIAADFRNVRQSWLWAVEKSDFACIDRATESLFVFSDMRSREYEGVELLEFALERLTPHHGDEPHPAWCRLLLPWYDLMLQSKGRPENKDEIKAQTEINLALARKRDDPLGIAHGLLLMGHFSKSAKALEMYEQVLDLVPRLDDSFWVRIRVGFCHRSMGEYQKAIQAFWQSHARGREIGENEKMGWSLFNIGETEILLGDLVNAETHMREANNHFRQVGTYLGVIGANTHLSMIMLLTGEFPEAGSLIEEAQEIARDANHPSVYRKEALVIFGYQALVEEDYQKAKNIFEEILSTFNTSPEGSLGMAYAACGLEDYSTATQNIQKALQPSSQYRIPMMAMLCVPAAALILAHDGETELSMELLALAFHHPASPAKMLGKWPQVTKLGAALEAKLSPEIYTAALERGRRLEIEEIFSKLADKFGVADGVTEKAFRSPLGAS